MLSGTSSVKCGRRFTWVSFSIAVLFSKLRRMLNGTSSIKAARRRFANSSRTLIGISSNMALLRARKSSNGSCCNSAWRACASRLFSMPAVAKQSKISFFNCFSNAVNTFVENSVV